MTYLENLRIFYISERRKGKDHKTIVKNIGENIWGSGMMCLDANYFAGRGAYAVQYGMTSSGM